MVLSCNRFSWTGCWWQYPLLLGRRLWRPPCVLWRQWASQGRLWKLIRAIPQRYTTKSSVATLHPSHLCLYPYNSAAVLIILTLHFRWSSGCFYTTSGGLQSFEHPLNELKAVPRVDSQGQMCGSTFKVDSEAKKDSGIPRVGSAADWSNHF